MDIDSNTLHWLAGLLEGEAYFSDGIPSYPNRRYIAVQMTDKDIVARMANLFDTKYVLVPPAKAHWKLAYKFTLSGRRAVQLMKLVYPLMGMRRQQKIDTALAFYISPVRNSHAKLNEEQVREIKQRIAAKEKAQTIALDEVRVP